ncbi:MAG: ankyrin repeat domain-containing protein [Candidatus Dependentiae bacterium]|nr:ankyrin repeat domain-containing protein [Candidatus Dependentiae bacterium]
MTTIKQLIIAATLLISLASVTDIYAGPATSRLQAARLQAANKALLTAAESGNLTAAINALRAGANVNTADKWGWTPLLVATEKGHTEIATMLIQAKAEVDKAAHEGSTPLLVASKKGHTEIATMLIQAKAEVDKAMQEGWTPLLVASEKGYTEIATMLIQAKAEVDKAAHEGSTPLTWASEKGYTEIATMLLEAKAEVNKANQEEWTSLAWASQNGHTEIAAMLLGAKAEVDKANQYGETPLLWASHDGHTEIATMLIQAKAGVNKADHMRVTPLMRASEKGHIDVVKILIAHDANPNIVSKTGHTAIRVASPNMLQVIKEARAIQPQPDAQVRCVAQPIPDLSVMLALAVAAERPGHQQMVPWLLKLDPQAREQAGDCSICADSFVNLVGNKAELRRTNQACQHLVCDICEQKQKLIRDVAPLTRCPMGCHKSREAAFKPTEAQVQEFERLQLLFLGAAQEEQKDGNDDEPHFFD